ncbi:hypothetical protein EJB05_40538, partial [Eragrostis curvula]
MADRNAAAVATLRGTRASTEDASDSRDGEAMASSSDRTVKEDAMAGFDRAMPRKVQAQWKNCTTIVLSPGEKCDDQSCDEECYKVFRRHGQCVDTGCGCVFRHPGEETEELS